MSTPRFRRSHRHKQEVADYRRRTKPRNVAVIVDGDDIYGAPYKMFGRSPDQGERVDWKRLAWAAKWKIFGAREVELAYFQRQDIRAEAFHAFLGHIGYDVHLFSGEKGILLAPLNAIMGRLIELQDRDVDVVYVGGNPFYGSIAKMLHGFVDQGRRVAVLHYDGSLHFECEHLDYRALGRDIGVIPAFTRGDADLDSEQVPAYTRTRHRSAFGGPVPHDLARDN